MGSLRSRGIIRPWEVWHGMPEEKRDELVEAELFPLPVTRPIPPGHPDYQRRENYDAGKIRVTPREYRMVKDAVDNAVRMYKEKHPEVSSDAEALQGILKEWKEFTTGQQPTNQALSLEQTAGEDH